jgi:hypothetical protein
MISIVEKGGKSALGSYNSENEFVNFVWEIMTKCKSGCTSLKRARSIPRIGGEFVSGYCYNLNTKSDRKNSW